MPRYRYARDLGNPKGFYSQLLFRVVDIVVSVTRARNRSDRKTVWHGMRDSLLFELCDKGIPDLLAYFEDARNAEAGVAGGILVGWEALGVARAVLRAFESGAGQFASRNGGQDGRVIVAPDTTAHLCAVVFAEIVVTALESKFRAHLRPGTTMEPVESALAFFRFYDIDAVRLTVRSTPGPDRFIEWVVTLAHKEFAKSLRDGRTFEAQLSFPVTGACTGLEAAVRQTRADADETWFPPYVASLIDEVVAGVRDRLFQA